MRFLRALLVFGLTTTPVLMAQTVHLDQGWTKDQRNEFYYTAQGSHLIPYDWFLVLEQANSPSLFRETLNMQSYGILTDKPSARNPDGLPIGFVRDGVDPERQKIAPLAAPKLALIKAATNFEIKKAYLGADSSENHYPVESQAWFGLTCAACHTHELDFGGKTIRIAGGSTMADLESFLRDLAKSLNATHVQPRKLRRFAKRLGRDASDIEHLKAELGQMSGAVSRLVERNKAKHAYGFGRLDAFGAILNAVCETALNDPRNRRESNAPVSYPTLWNTPFMGYVQWGASAPFAEARNVGEVLGVFGCFDLASGPKPFDSTVRLANLVHLEHDLLKKLKSPPWPEEILGKLDHKKIQQGKKLFKQNCQSCHPVRGSDGKFVLNSADRIAIRSSTPQEVRTDPLFLQNLAPQHLAFTGELKPLLGNKDQVPRTELLSLVVGAIMKERATAEQIDLRKLMPGPQDPPNPNGAGFIARPLEGIWSSAPYFHNGSVPNLYETLLPASKRSTSFLAGSRNFDPIKVGIDSKPAGVGSVFNMHDGDGKPIPGNLNVGHEGHGTSVDEGFTQTFENGAWRDFTEQERYALIEYMKWLPGE